MAIAPISIPTYSSPRDLDFSPLAQLPQVYRQAQRDAWTLANIDKLYSAQALTPAMKEYDLARRQGFNGTFMDFRKSRLSQTDADPVANNARPSTIPDSGTGNAVDDRLRRWGVGVGPWR